MLYFEELNNFYKLLEIEIFKNNGIIYGNYPCEKLLMVNQKIEFIKTTNIKIAFKHGEDHILFYSFIPNNINIINGLNISIEITISNDEPPYKNNNYSCYGLLLSKYGFHYSRNTGTIYDNYETSYITKMIVANILKKTTNYIRGFNLNYDIFNDIYNMIKDNWIIENLPYKLYYDNNDDNDDNNDNCCPICLEKLKTDEIAFVNKYKIHHKCLVKFLRTQKNEAYFKCPYRSKIDFRDCYLSIIL
jgi:hypothetical protein